MLYILDGSGFLFRAYYSLPAIKDKDGNDAGAIFGFYRMILKLLQEKPSNFIIVFDPGTKTKRQEEFKEYKANRPEIDDSFKKQIPQIINIAKESGFDIEIIPEYEADDVIASISKSYSDKKVIVSSDKDLKQLIDKNTQFLEPKKMEYIDKEKFEKEFGFSPNSLSLYLALIGDSSDNIPGIKGIGPKTAKKIVQEYKNIEEIEKNLDKLPENIKNNLEQIKKNIKLIELRYPGNFKNEEIKKKSNIKNINFDKLKEILVNKYGFKSFEKLIDKTKNEIKKPENLSLF